MIRLIVSAALLVVLAVFLSFNLQSTSSVSLFGFRIDQIPVGEIALLSFAAGVVYSLFLYVGHLLHLRKKKDLAERHKKLAEREQAMDAREAVPAAGPAQHPKPASESPSTGEAPAQSATKGGVRKWWIRHF